MTRDSPDSPRLGTEAGRLALGAAVLALLLGACSTAFDPYADGPPFFALDGLLDSRDDTLFLRVQDLAVPPAAPAAPLDATVTFENLTSGQTAMLRDSLVSLPDGATVHLFWTTTPFQGGNAYRLRAARDADPSAASEATFQVPEPGLVPLNESDPAASLRPLLLNGILARPFEIEVVYEVRREDTGATAIVRSSYSPINQTTEIRVQLAADAVRIRTALRVETGNPTPVVVTRASVVYLAVSPLPIAIEDGLGEIVWMARLTVPWQIPAPALQTVGLTDGQGA